MKKRYAVCVIEDAECTEIGAIQHEMASLEDAKRSIAELDGAPYGYAIRDAETGLIDWGFGFGVFVPDVSDVD